MVATTTPSGRRHREFSDFRQFQPHVDADPSFKTEFQVAYDEKNLYVFVRMFDPHPDSIMHALVATRRARVRRIRSSSSSTRTTTSAAASSSP